MKKLKKVFSKGTIIGKTRDASLYRAITDSSKDIWTSREKSVEVDAMGAYIDMLTRPAVFSHGRVDTGGLALYDSVELNEGESLLELGSGAGLVGLLTAVREKESRGVRQMKFIWLTQVFVLLIVQKRISKIWD